MLIIIGDKMNSKEKLEELCKNCKFNSEYCNVVKCNQYEKIAKGERDTIFSLYIVVDEKELLVRHFNNNDLIEIKEWIENFLEDSRIDFEKLFFYRNEENNDEIVVNYGGLMYFIIKEEEKLSTVASII